MKPDLQASHFVDGNLLETQSYTFSQSNRRRAISEQGSFERHPDVHASCEFELSPRGYAAVQVRFEHGEVKVAMSLVRTGDQIALDFNGTQSELTPALTADGMLLLDGPNPMFDYQNALQLLGLRNGESRTVPVHIIDYQNGRLIRSDYTFHRQSDSQIVIDKRLGENSWQIQLDLEDGSYAPLRHSEAKHVHEFDCIN